MSVGARTGVAPGDEWHGASDAQLAVAIQRRKHGALAEAYQRHAGVVLSLAGRLLPSRALAEDVTQEVFLRLWRDPLKYDPSRGTLRSYLLAHAHGRATDLRRSETSRWRREAASGGSQPTDHAVEREVEDIMVADQVREAMLTLSADERHAIVLAYLGGHTYREVAVIMGQPEGTTKSRIRSGIRRLREPLEQAGVRQ